MEEPEVKIDWGYENDPKAEVWWGTSWTESGGNGTLRIWRDKFGSKILTKPTLKKDGMWHFSFTNPLTSSQKNV